MAQVIQNATIHSAQDVRNINAYIRDNIGSKSPLQQDSVWASYLDFLDTTLQTINTDHRDQPGPFLRHGFRMTEFKNEMLFQPDQEWQYDLFSARVHNDLRTFIKITPPEQFDLLREFAYLHRLEWWADTNTQSPLLAHLSGNYRKCLKRILEHLARNTTANDADIFDAMQLFPGLDANRIFCNFIEDQAMFSQIQHITDSIQYRPRTANLYAEAE